MAKEKKLKDVKQHDRRRANLNKRMGNKRNKKTVIIQILSDNSTKDNSLTNIDGDDLSTTNYESSTNKIPDDLNGLLSKELGRSNAISSPAGLERRSPILDLSNLALLDRSNNPLQTIINGISSDSELSIISLLRKKKKITKQ